MAATLTQYSKVVSTLKNAYEVRGEVTAILFKRRDGMLLETLIDTTDLPIVNSFKNSWYLHWNPDTKSFYVVGRVRVQGRLKKIQLHRLIMSPSDDMVVDHINHDTLDNRRSNLRVVTDAQNLQNRKGARKDSKSGIRGVYWNSQLNKWQAYVRLDKKLIHVGVFENINDAASCVSRVRAALMPYSKDAQQYDPGEHIPFKRLMEQRERKRSNGISWHKGSKKWQVRKTIDGKRKWLGQFDTKEEAERFLAELKIK